MAYNRSKAKGSRVEYEVRDYFRLIGYEAHRVPASGAAQGFPGDVMIRDKEGKSYIIEVKARATEFDKVYAYIDPRLKAMASVYAVVKHRYTLGKARSGFDASYSFSDLIENALPTLSVDLEHAKDVRRIDSLYKYLGRSDILVIKGDRRKLLFIRFV